MNKQMYVYILECADKSYYTGVTNNLERRLKEHQHGINMESYTYSRRPVRLKFYELCNTTEEAFKLEKRIKGWSRAKKVALINGNWDKLRDLSACKNDTHFKNRDVNNQ